MSREITIIGNSLLLCAHKKKKGGNMPRIVDCAFAISKNSLPNMQGMIRKAQPGEKSAEVYRSNLVKNDNDRFIFYKKMEYDSPVEKWAVKDASKATIAEPNSYHEAARLIETKRREGYLATQYDFLVANVLVANGWYFNLRKLKMWLAAGGEKPRVEEYDDHITLFFQADYEFPCGLVEKLGHLGVKWSGIWEEYGRVFRNGNADLGLRAVTEKTNERDSYGEQIVRERFEDVTGRR